MADVSSLELSKELYSLSDWENYQGLQWAAKDDRAEPELVPIQEGKSWPDGYFTSWPAYTCGYLLRKLPPYCTVHITGDGRGVAKRVHKSEPIIVFDGSTPEDALAKLAIELIKQGVINGR